MRNFFTTGGRIAVFTAISMLLSIPAFSQLSLRRALDTDLDGRADFSIYRPSNNTWYTMGSGGGFAILQFGLANEDFVAPGDFDGDGRGDVSVWRDTTGVWYRINSSNNTFSAFAWGLTGDEPVARDYDGDGRTDLAIARRTNGQLIWFILRSSDGVFSGGHFGLSTDFTAPGDYDGDGRFDLAVQRPGATAVSQSTFFINGTTSGFQVIPWGLSNDLVVPGDYDGDGRTDVAVLREGTVASPSLTWLIRRSTDGSLLGAVFGTTATDLNVQNDYDGDGRTDIAVWRNSEGFFYVLPSTTGVPFVVAWGSPNDFPVASYDTH